ncbi:hypothetical protein HYH03_000672 [Edaphochlamys debaryana]|uniref:Uncharacterized protein n=1 Tax=Edaphochlamys debaryana TaxID=47281 RepID=A0A835YG43_9CHLO|nr:hypothetical protein HYH03_000672 [Edaphochlamys debaryana]|eukprot:KAG2502185.1 hypothetical protein HYH03_000672 [Edaphochlamys debaryana]
MPQGALKAKKTIVKKKEAANRHGKAAVTRKGKFDKPPKKGKALEAYNESQDLTKAINKRNEGNAAGVAESKGGKLKMIKAPPPILAPKHKKVAEKAQPEPEADEMSD